MKHVLPELPYAVNALEPAIDSETLALHHGKHHRAYVDKLNAVLADYPQYQLLSIEALLRSLGSLDSRIRGDVRNHGGGHANHSLLWQTLSPHGGTPGTALFRLIVAAFGSLDGLKEEFRNAAARTFGSGWVFLISPATSPNTLQVVALPNQDSPLSIAATPLLGLDLWEHAYYLKFRNNRTGWLDAWWDIVNWEAVEHNFDVGELLGRQKRSITSSR